MKPYISSEGDVISSNLYARPTSKAQDSLFSEMKLMRGQIINCYTVDDPDNTPGSPGKFTTYDVQITRVNGATEIARNVRGGQPLWGGGIFDYMEVGFGGLGQKAKDNSVDSGFRPGATVLLGFIEGQKNSGVILCAIPHPSDKAKSARPKRAKGKNLSGEFAGLNFEVSKDGALTVTFNGPRDENGIAGDNGPTSFTMDGTGGVKIETNSGQSIVVDRSSNTTTITNDDGIVTIRSGKITVVSPEVDIGSGALQPMVVGDDWKSIMGDLCDAIQQIMVPCPLGPSGTPINASKFAAIKGKLSDALSAKHKVEK
jgi:hypothetical protein